MRIRVSTQFIYGWLEFKEGTISRASEAWENWEGRSLVAFFYQFQEKKFPINVETPTGWMSVERFYVIYAGEFTQQENINEHK